jgi:hypothetical protein
MATGTTQPRFLASKPVSFPAQAEEEPQDQAKGRQDQDEQDPQHLLARGCGAFLAREEP